jgi:AraC-like DNA-binding protein
MPLFMDLHKASDYDQKPTVEDIKLNHIADLAVQHKYGVKFLQYWINEEAGLVFCLMEAPNKEACAAVHREAHGAMPCNVIELKGGDYRAYIGENINVNQFDIVERTDGTLDTGYRVILVADFISISGDVLPIETIRNAKGNVISQPGNRETLVFMNGQDAIECALNMISHAKKGELRIGISAGEPVTDQQDLFGDAIRLANRLCDIAQDKQVVVSSLAKELTHTTSHDALKLLNKEDEQFLHQLIESIASLLSNANFPLDTLSDNMSMSRSTLYRKITELTGGSAKNLIHELKMQKALRLLRNKQGNVTQVAFELGYSNPSYFAKTFRERFGIAPSQL